MAPTKKTAARKSTKLAPAAKNPTAKTTVPEKKEKRRTMVAAALAMIRVGKTNAEVLEMLKREFKLPEGHSYYARWYRSWAVQKKFITREFAKAHAGRPDAAAKP